MNQLMLEAYIVEREAVRYTPAGIPIVHCLLHHCSQVYEAGIARQVEMEMPAVAAGELSGSLERCALGQVFSFTGFLAPRSRRARALRFHLTALQTTQKD